MNTADRPQGRIWKGAHAARTGPSHAATGTPCQDRAFIACPERGDGTLIAAVTDGAGTSPEAGAGAETALRAAVRSLSQGLREPGQTPDLLPDLLPELLAQAAASAHAELARRALAEGNPLRYYNTTLVIAVHTGETLATLHVGDGAVAAAREGGPCELVSPPEQGEYANETRFITDPDHMERLRVRVETGSRWDRIALFTDGLQRMVLDYSSGSPEPHHPFFETLFAWLEAQAPGGSARRGLAGLLASPGVSGKSHDDVSIAAASRRTAR